MRSALHHAAIAVLAILVFGTSSAAPSAAAPERANLFRSISISPKTINPTLGGAATLDVQLRHSGRLDVQVVDRDGFPVRTLPTKNGAAGSNQVVWDGRDDHGEIVPDEAWSFRVIADGGVEEWFPAARHAPMIAIDPLAFSRTTATLRYQLPVPSRVHVQAGTISPEAGLSTEGPVLKTIVDREPRDAGFVAEHWNGFDASGAIYVPDLPGFAIAIAATPLPESSVITFGNAKRTFLAYAARRTGHTLFPHKDRAAHHVGLDVFHDVAPTLTVAPLDSSARRQGSLWEVSEAFRFRVGVEGPTASAFEQEPGKIFIFVDSRLVSTRDAKEAGAPFQIVLSDDREHRMAVNWRSDYGPVAVAVARIRGAPSTGKGAE